MGRKKRENPPPQEVVIDDVLGSSRAESDAHMLDVAFVPTTDFESLVRGPNHNFVVGRRGAGKSAMFLQLSKKFAGRGDVTVSFVPQEHLIKGLVAALRRRFPGEAMYSPVRSLMRVVWRAALTASVARSYRHKKGNGNFASTYVPPEWDRPDLVETAHVIVDSLPETIDPDALVYQAAVFTRCDELEEELRRNLVDSGSRAIVLVDRLDEGWRPQEIEAGIVGGLCAAAIDLRDRKTNVHGLIFLRDNVFRILEDIDDDFSRNIAGDNLRLRWTPETLLDLVTRRLREVTGFHDPAPMKVWNRFAKHGLENMEGFSVCLQKTLYRPRDILELLNKARHVARARQRQELIADDVEEAAQDIAKSRLGDLLKEYEEVFPGLGSIVHGFSGRKATDSLRNVLELLEQTRPKLPGNASRSYARLGSPAGVLLALFGVGFLGYELTGSGFQFCHDGADAPPSNLAHETLIAVHPCYSRALDIEQTPETSFDVLLAVNDEYDERKPAKKDVAQLLGTGATRLLKQLGAIPTGDTGAGDFEQWAFEVLRLLFAGDLSNFEMKPNKNAPKRRDIVASNDSVSGVWKRLLHARKAGQIAFEVKNFDDLGSAAYHQAFSYATLTYGNMAFIVYRSLRGGLNENERSWVQQCHGDGTLLVLVPTYILSQCLRKQIKDDREDYTRRTFGRWVDTHMRDYVNPRAGARA